MRFASRRSLGFFCGRILPADQGLKEVKEDHRMLILTRPLRRLIQCLESSVCRDCMKDDMSKGFLLPRGYAHVMLRDVYTPRRNARDIWALQPDEPPIWSRYLHCSGGAEGHTSDFATSFNRVESIHVMYKFLYLKGCSAIYKAGCHGGLCVFGCGILIGDLMGSVCDTVRNT